MDAGHRDRFIRTNGVRLHAVEAGPDDGPLVILLHGFPELWYGWRKQIGPLAHAGFRVLVPDQRGYNTSDKPAGVGAYVLDELAADVVGLIDDAGRERAAVVGHDWGAAVAWWLAGRHPERVEKLAILNVPHPFVMQRQMRRSPPQMLKSWYVVFLQIPKLPEALMRVGGYRPMFASLRRTGRADAFDDADEEVYRRAWSEPGAMTAMINWYRTMPRYFRRVDAFRVASPVLMIWGVRDRFLEFDTARKSIELCDRGRLVAFDDATHWVHHEEPAQVNELLRGFLSAECW